MQTSIGIVKESEVMAMQDLRQCAASERIENDSLLTSAFDSYETLKNLLSVGYLYPKEEEKTYTEHLEHLEKNKIVKRAFKASPHRIDGGCEVYWILDKTSVEIAIGLLENFYPDLPIAFSSDSGETFR